MLEKQTSHSITIVIRAKNEERWIRRTIKGICEQTIQDYEVVLVDNCSTDNTRKIFEEMLPHGKVITLDVFTPGRAINLGIAEGGGEFIVLLSAHCVPESRRWLETLLQSMSDERVGASYGRQLPLPTSHPFDRRDLLNTFGVESRTQKKDSFFHNANSIIRRNIWKQFPFDEQTPHIEDRIWAGQIIDAGYWIAYEADAAVYHHHGINHHRDVDRAHAISEILTHRTMANGHYLPDVFHAGESTTLYCFLGHDIQTSERLSHVLNDMGETFPPGSVFVHSKVPEQVPASVTCVKRHSCENEMTFVDILARLLSEAEGKKIYPDCVAYMNLQQSRASGKFIVESVQAFFEGMYDSVFFGESEYSNVWVQSHGEYRQVEANYLSRERKHPIFIARYGLGMATRPQYIRNGELVGKKVGIIQLP